MIIGLVRHFKVTYKPKRTWMTSDQFNQWIEQYDQSDIHRTGYRVIDLKWDVCLSSDLPRAAETARVIFQGPIITTDQLREISIRSIGASRIRLHYYIWLLLSRAAWLVSHPSQQETRAETLHRAQQLVDRIEENENNANVLVVSHGAFMKSLTQELHRRGYKGKGFLKPRNGKLYRFERK